MSPSVTNYFYNSCPIATNFCHKQFTRGGPVAETTFTTRSPKVEVVAEILLHQVAQVEVAAEILLHQEAQVQVVAEILLHQVAQVQVVAESHLWPQAKKWHGASSAHSCA